MIQYDCTRCGKNMTMCECYVDTPDASERATGQPGANNWLPEGAMKSFNESISRYLKRHPDLEWMNPRDLEADGTPRDYRDPQEKP
jgi:hypothetical protein